MAFRVSDADVKALMVGTELTEGQIHGFLVSANRLVTARCEPAGYSEEELIEMEKWLAAHLASCVDPMVAQETIGPSTVRYHGQTGKDLDFTPFGQHVKLLDYKKRLDPAGKESAEIKLLMD